MDNHIETPSKVIRVEKKDIDGKIIEAPNLSFRVESKNELFLMQKNQNKYIFVLHGMDSAGDEEEAMDFRENTESEADDSETDSNADEIEDDVIIADETEKNDDQVKEEIINENNAKVALLEGDTKEDIVNEDDDKDSVVDIDGDEQDEENDDSEGTESTESSHSTSVSDAGIGNRKWRLLFRMANLTIFFFVKIF